MAGSKSNVAKLLRQGDLWLVFGLFGTILLLILPVPPFLLDALLAMSIALSLLVVLLILVLINFVVITKGAGRIAEVAARFTLDALPGKQMAIDAELNAGVINEGEARSRRRKVEQEADFYGAMDGASKFVRGDAIAAVLITLINVLGGFAIGIIQKGMSVSEALQRYTLLSIGDGLVSQIPALITSTAAGILVTRAASKNDLGQDLGRQLLFYPRALMVLTGML